MPASILTPDFTARPAPPRPEIGPRRPLATLTSYEVVKQHAAQAKAATAKAAREAVDEDTGTPLWAVSAQRPRFYDFEGKIKRKRSALGTLVRERGVFSEHASPPCERTAIVNLETQADLFMALGGRVLLTREEHTALAHERYFLTHFESQTVDRNQKQTRAYLFGVDHDRWIRGLPGKLGPTWGVSYAAYRMGSSVQRAQGLIENGGLIVELRALLDYDDDDLFAVQAEPAWVARAA